MSGPLPRRLWTASRLSAIFVRELFASAVAVARAAFAREPLLSPAIIAVPCELKSDQAITALANLVSLTPGTTSLHVSLDRKTLYVHCLDAPTAEVVSAHIKATFESCLKELER